MHIELGNRRVVILVGLSLVFGVAGFFYANRFLRAQTHGPIADDYTWHWLAGKAVIEGKDPYETVTPGGPHQLNAGYLYPMPAAIVATPFSFFTPITAASVFCGVSVAVLVFGIGLTGCGRLPMLAGVPFLWAAAAGQMSLLSTGAALVPGLGWPYLLSFTSATKGISAGPNPQNWSITLPLVDAP